jgi:hypothetical protein
MTIKFLEFVDMILDQIADCEYCGDGIAKDQMTAHLEWCKPMIEGNLEQKIK